MSKIAVGVRVLHKYAKTWATIKETRGNSWFRVNWDDGKEGEIWLPADDFTFPTSEEGPVRTVIVDGLYGIVAVYHEQDQVRVTLTREDGTPDQLEAAARTLQQLAEALREG